MSIANELLKLQQLKEAGVLTDAEFLKAKELVLGSQSIPEGESRTARTPNTKTNDRDGAEMIYIPAGEFVMGGSNGNGDASEHKVILDDYYIYKYPVTVAMYKKFCDATGHTMPEAPPWGWNNTNYPIVNVSWNNATAYCAWARADLPSEAEWEKAARGTDARLYPWGGSWNPDNCVNSVNMKLDSPAVVGSIPEGASPYGVLDMIGNVSQWCADWYDSGYYDRSPNRNPKGPTNGQYRVLRGGTFLDRRTSYFTCIDRPNTEPGTWTIAYGFRCVVHSPYLIFELDLSEVRSLVTEFSQLFAIERLTNREQSTMSVPS